MDHRYGSIHVSPLLVGLLVVMGAALIVAMVHCLIVACCNDHIPTGQRTTSATIPVSQRQNVEAQDYTGQASSSISFSNVQILVASNYNEEFKEGVCAVCLSEFKQGDEVRVLLECAHVFHVSCIDQWLHSHHNCPLCRAETLPSPQDLVCSLPNSALVPFPPAELHGGS